VPRDPWRPFAVAGPDSRFRSAEVGDRGTGRRCCVTTRSRPARRSDLTAVELRVGEVPRSRFQSLHLIPARAPAMRRRGDRCDETTPRQATSAPFWPHEVVGPPIASVGGRTETLGAFICSVVTRPEGSPARRRAVRRWCSRAGGPPSRVAAGRARRREGADPDQRNERARDPPVSAEGPPSTTRTPRLPSVIGRRRGSSESLEPESWVTCRARRWTLFLRTRSGTRQLIESSGGNLRGLEISRHPLGDRH